jgi:hypothetical protein
MISSMRRLSIFLLLSLVGCSSQETQSLTVQAEQALRSQESLVPFSAPGQRWKFSYPKHAKVRATRFDPSTPVHKVKERIEVLKDEKLAVKVDVWDNPEKLSPSLWIDTHASYLRSTSTEQSEWHVGPEHRPTLLLLQPRSCQAPSLAISVFSTENQIVSVTCADAEDPELRHIFDTLLGSFEAGGMP